MKYTGRILYQDWIHPGVRPGQLDAACGRIAMESIDTAINQCLNGQAQAMVTAPISKEAITAGRIYGPRSHGSSWPRRNRYAALHHDAGAAEPSRRAVNNAYSRSQRGRCRHA